MGIMTNEPDLSTALRSMVYIRPRFVKDDGTLLYSSGTGVLVSQDTVFTVAHLFGWSPGMTLERIKVFQCIPGIRTMCCGTVAELQPFDRDMQALLCKRPGLTSFGEPWKLDYPDFAVLKLETPFTVDGNLLSIPELYDVPNSALKNGEVVSFLGLPDVPDCPPREALPYVLVQEMSDHFKDDAEAIFQQLLTNSCFGFIGSIVSFGAILRPFLKDQGEAFVNTTCSTIQGMSGGPVVNLAKPNELLGFCVGGRTASAFTVFFRADAPIVVEAFKRFVTTSASRSPTQILSKR